MEDFFTITYAFMIVIIIILVTYISCLTEKAEDDKPPYKEFLADYDYVAGHEYDVKDDGDLRTIIVYLEKKDAEK